MKWLLRVILVFLAVILFFPESGSRVPRNFELLLVILGLLFLYFTVRAFCFWLFVSRTRKRLLDERFDIKSCRYSPMGCYLIAEHNGVKKHACLHMWLLRPKTSWYRYHFEDAEHIELYSKIQFMARTRRGELRGVADANLAGKLRLRWQSEEGELRAVLFSRLPRSISDPINREALNEGDSLTGSGVMIHNEKSLARFLDTL